MKIDKAYILYIDDVKSKVYADKCVESCEDHAIRYELHLGHSGLTIEDLVEKTGWKIGREGIEDSDRQYVKEYNAALGHIDIWRDIAESGKAGVILEHDAVVKGDIHELEVHDGEILHLGPRMDYSRDYELPDDRDATYLPIRRHEGAHAYAMTPGTAKFLLEQIEKEERMLPTEALISVRNRYSLTLKEVDPPYVVCELGDRKSFTHHDEVTDRQNFKHHTGFIDGLRDESVMIDYRLMDYFFIQDWFSGNIDNWIRIFEETGKSRHEPLRVLEIGCYDGRATTWLVDNMLGHKDSLIFCVDTFAGSHEHNERHLSNLYARFGHNISVSTHPEKVRTMVGDSRIILPSLVRDPRKFDVIYVDGSHATLDVVNDGIYSLHLLKKNGIIIFDDYQWTDPVYGNQPVKKAIDFLDTHYPSNIKRIHDGYQRVYHKAP